MAGDKRELVLDLLARDKSGPATASFGKNIKDVGDAADKADTKLGKFTGSTTVAAHEADKLGDEAEQAARRLSKLDREIAITTAELKVMARQFADSADQAERLDISKAIRRTENDLRRLTKSKNLIDLPDPKPEVASWLTKFKGSMSGGLDTVSKGLGNQVGITIGAAAAVAIGPTILSGLGAAVTGAVGTIGLGAGVALAVAKDDMIKAAGKQAGKKFLDGLTGYARTAFQGPVLESITVLAKAGDQISDRWGAAFQKLAPALKPLVTQLSDFAVRFSDQIAGIAEKSGPEIEALGGVITTLGDGIGDFLESLSKGGPEAVSNLNMIAGVTADMIRLLGKLVEVSSWATKNLSIFMGILPILKGLYDNQSKGVGTWVDAQDEAARAVADTTQEVKAQTSALEGLGKELTAQSSPAFALMDAEDQLASAQRDAAKAAKEHGRGSRESDAALRKLAEAALNVEAKAEAVAGTFNGQMTPAMRATLQAAGLTRGQIDRLAAQFRAARKDGDSFAKTYRANAQVIGTEAASARVRNLRNLLAQVRSKTVSVSVLVRQTQLAKVTNQLGLDSRAVGGPVQKGVPYWVGEHGPEIMVPDGDGKIMTAASSRGRAAMGTGGALSAGKTTGGGGSTLRIELVGQAELVTMFRYLVRTANLLQEA